MPYPTPADRKDLSDLVSKNWENTVARPYSSWGNNQLSNYLTSTGKEVKKGTEKNTESLIAQVQNAWHESAEQANEAYGNSANWLFNFVLVEPLTFFQHMLKIILMGSTVLSSLPP